jgi:hypothetical protein
MPIKPANLARYPANWKDIRQQVLKRASYCCEHPGCGARQYAVGHWEKRASLWRWVPAHGNALHDLAGQGLEYPSCQPWTYAEARQFAADTHWSRFGDEDGDAKVIVIVLTVAHLDHVPEHCELVNLRALCQRHHLAHDQEHHRANAWATRRARLQTPDLFEDATCHPA